jgi:hypothetical protein
VVGEPAEEKRAEHRAGDIGRGAPADLAGAESERVVALQRGTERAHHRDFEAVEQPAHAEGDHDPPVPGRPGQPVQARGDGALYGRVVYLMVYHRGSSEEDP